MRDRTDGEKLAGCMMALLSLFIIVPLFCTMLYGVLSASNAPTWCWVLFWLYVPLTLVFGTIRAIFDEVCK